MIAGRRVALLAALVTASIPAVVQGQHQSSDSLVPRIVLLESKVAELDQRVRELEALIKAEPSRPHPISTSANWRDIANWRRLRRGMTPDQVREVLGEPDRVQAGSITYWSWGELPQAGEVEFIDEKLHGWSEPRQ